MSAPEQLRQAIADAQDGLRRSISANRDGVLRALLRVIDRSPLDTRDDMPPDLVTGRHVAALGANLALRLCLEAPEVKAEATSSAGNDLDAWSMEFLDACARLAEAELVLTHAQTGFMRLVANDDGTFAAWVATKQLPASWRERADIDWWAAWLARRQQHEFQAIAAANDGIDPAARYCRLAEGHLATMAYQRSYPADAVIGGVSMHTYADVLRALIARAEHARDRGVETQPQSGLALIADLAAELNIAPELAATALAGFTLDADNAAYHAALPGAPLAPLVRITVDRLIWSWRGLMTEPFFFLFRELRRRDAQGYHNGAHLREGVFRDDLYALFADKRFVTSPSRIVLRRAAGDARTDIDAAVFDRKSGALALFELKAHDPLARTSAELMRQRDNVLYANRQVGGMLDWVKRHGADEILNRIERRSAKTFRVQKVYPFVLGRYLVHFHDGPQPDPRAAWGTWPQLLRLRDGQPFGPSESHPLGALFTRLRNDSPPIEPIGDRAAQEIAFGATRVTVYPSFGAYRAHAGDVAGARVRTS